MPRVVRPQRATAGAEMWRSVLLPHPEGAGGGDGGVEGLPDRAQRLAMPWRCRCSSPLSSFQTHH